MAGKLTGTGSGVERAGALVNGRGEMVFHFQDPTWTNQPTRYYHVRQQ